MSVNELQHQLTNSSPLTVIDVRSPALFVQGHIPGAINIPASLCPLKKVPPLGKVIVCGAGLGRDETDTAASALAAKPGVTVEILEGGFAAWESAHFQTTRAKGRQSEAVNYISYAQLKAVKPEEVVLVDLRQSPRPPAQTRALSAVRSDPPLTDLAREFPNLPSTPSAFALPQTRRTLAPRSITAPLLVLIDNGDGTAEAMGRTLKANGNKRYAILLGGETILARHGQPGLQRSSPGTRLLNPISTASGTPRP